MEQSAFKVRMPGEFSIAFGDTKVADTANRPRKVWLLLAYLIFNRDQSAFQEELIGKQKQSPCRWEICTKIFGNISVNFFLKFAQKKQNVLPIVTSA